MVTSCCISVRSMLPHPVLRHAGGRLAPASQCCPWRCAACRNTPAALTGARGASCREWSERLEARGCRSTLRRMRAAKAARQATGIVATRSPLLQLCFADQKRPSFAFSPPKFMGGHRGCGQALPGLDPVRLVSLVGWVCSSGAQKEGKNSTATLTVDSLDTPSSTALKSWLVVARSASARVQLVRHLGWVHRQEARAVGRPRERMGGRR